MRPYAQGPAGDVEALRAVLPPQMLAGRVYIVTGGGRGLGAAVVHAALQAGARVLSADLAHPQGAPPSQHEHRVLANVALAADRERLVEEAFLRFGALDGVVNNAALNIARPFLETTEEDWDRVQGVGLRAAFFLTQAAVRRAQATPAPAPAPMSIVNMCSVHALAGMPGAGPYDAAKGGMLALTRTLAVELAAPAGGARAARVNCVSPGLCDTQMVRDYVFDAAPDRAKAWAYWQDNIPQRRMVSPEEVAAPVVFLLSEGAAAITGHNLVVDGGMTARLLSTPPYDSKQVS